MMFTFSALLFSTNFRPLGTNDHGPGQVEGPNFNGSTGWINSEPLALANLRGKVVLVDFWTYTCINWRRTMPYIREWEAKYKDQGLVVIGVHTPEFFFERQLENVRRSVKEMNINFPVVMDNDFAIWRSFKNQYWPALYLVDGKGMLRYQKFGEGDYTEPELQIQKLLGELSSKNIATGPSVVHADRYEVAADWEQLRSPENFLGYDRTEGFVSPEGKGIEKPVLYSMPRMMKLNQWALSGNWIMGKEHVSISSGEGKIIYRFQARDLHLIMGSAIKNTPVKFRVMIDGAPPGDAHGLDIDNNGYGTLNEYRMYQIIRQQGVIKEREFQIEFMTPGVEVFDFTFG